MSKAVKSVTKAVVAPVKSVVSSVNDARKDVTKAVVPTAVYKPVSKTAQKIGSTVNDVRKDVTRKGLNAVADVVKPLGPAGVPLLTAALTPMLGPAAAAVASGLVTAGRAVDRGAGLTQAGKAGLTSGAISGLASYGGQALSKALDPYVQSGIGKLVSPETLKQYGVTPQMLTKYATKPLTSGTIQGGLGALLTGQKFGQGFLQGAGNSVLGSAVDSFLGDYIKDKDYRGAAGDVLQDKIAPLFGLGGAKKPTRQAGGFGEVGGDNEGVDGVSGGSGADGSGFDFGALLPYLIGGAGGAGLATLLNKKDTPAAPAAPTGPTVPGTLTIGQIGQAYVPQQNTNYGGMMGLPLAG